MSAPADNKNKALISGRIDAIRSYSTQGGERYETRVIQPAADQYSSPSAVAITSKKRIGGKGEDINVLVTVAGFKDSWTDKSSGEVQQTARNTLYAVE
ncbi:hypothetical protein [Noviherbaspirillum sedimenti]|uniref:Single-stranded DNA-binding protein n=1 Tax=Noviherbaspirillum sedimenti TaxID=2320865 RepID=A0A3A3GFB8_9BURK|nr:hypothetical protein [Noviherbaspirillum sedimenti]RJG00956.1 hypothetical protein D3878_04610 [Noviherbaspirillum sedimenti]